MWVEPEVRGEYLARSRWTDLKALKQDQRHRGEIRLCSPRRQSRTRQAQMGHLKYVPVQPQGTSSTSSFRPMLQYTAIDRRPPR